MLKTMEKQLLDRYREMVHGLYEEAVRDIIAGTFDNIGDIKLGPRQNQNKSNTPKKKKKEIIRDKKYIIVF